jgi:enamine deaminase RidA (YjgF/YER057c/UK114 family)
MMRSAKLIGSTAVDIERINPDGLAGRPFYHHVVRSSSRHLIHISGQVGLDAEGNVVGAGDFAAHVGQAYANLDLALDAAEVGREDVVKVTTFVVDYDHDVKWSIIKAAHSSFFVGAIPAWTVVGVQALARPELLIEIEAIAASD